MNPMESRIILGCMRIAALEATELRQLVETSLAEGVNFFDHADVYGKGRCEELFGEILAGNPGLRENIVIQTKCGIRPGLYDFSKEHILRSVEQSLRRLKTDYVDVLLLHRPDTLMEPEEVAEAFTTLEAAGKVRWFGVSNHHVMHIELLQKWLPQKLRFNQLQFGPAHTGIIDAGINVNLYNDRAVDRDGGILEYCRLKGITIQAWSPLQFGFFKGVFLGHPDYAELNRVLERIGEEQGVTPAAVAIAWVLRHPAQMQVVVGTTNACRVKELSQAEQVSLTREQWYEIYRAAGNKLP